MPERERTAEIHGGRSLGVKSLSHVPEKPGDVHGHLALPGERCGHGRLINPGAPFYL